MKKLFNYTLGSTVSLLFCLFAGCEKKPLEEDNPSGGGGSNTPKGTIEGVVTVKGTDAPVMLASVTLQPGDRLTLTDTAGAFTLSGIEPGNYKIQVKRNGYSTHTSEEIKVEGGRTVRHNVALESLSADLQILDIDGGVIKELVIGDATTKGVFVLKNAGEEIVEWNIPKLAVDWITDFSKMSGKLAPDASETVELSIDRSKLTSGDNEATLYIGSSVGDKQLLIKAHVERSFCFTDESGEEILEVEFADITQQYRFTIKNTGNDELTWGLSAIDWKDWLQFVGKTEGKLAAGESESRTLKVNYDPGEGTHETRINFSTNAGEKTLPVRLKIERSCRLEDRNGDEISELDLGRLTEGSFKIRNTGSGKLTWEIQTVEAEWLTLGDKKSGSLQPGSAETVDMTIDPSLLVEGDNRATLNIRTNAGDRQLQIKAYRLQFSDAIPETVYVEGGTFMMGATEEQGLDVEEHERPVHEVTLDGFHIGKYEITQKQWEAVMGTTVEEQRDKVSPTLDLVGVGDDHPIYYVSWNEAVEFCEKLSRMTGKTYRLPTEAEWEYAARGGQHADGTKYAGSNTLGDVAWYSNNSSDGIHPVGQKQPNGLELYDMSGNVWEWCSDWYGEYSSSAEVNPQGPASGSTRIFRGGAWSTTQMCRVSYRNANRPVIRTTYLGFRVVLEL